MVALVMLSMPRVKENGMVDFVCIRLHDLSLTKNVMEAWNSWLEGGLRGGVEFVLHMS